MGHFICVSNELISRILLKPPVLKRVNTKVQIHKFCILNVRDAHKTYQITYRAIRFD